MHFTTIYILKGETLDSVSKEFIESDFYKRFCYGCGENIPKYQYWCDWFQIGGRWCDLFKAKKGIRCDRNYPNENSPIVKNHFSVVEIKDLTEPIDSKYIYAIATKSRIYQHSDEWGGNESGINQDKYNDLLKKINNKQINGVIALIDCHD